MTTTYPQLKATKPTGGFVFLTVQQLCLIWWAYRTRLIQLMDFRVWFAAHEMVARRCKLEPDQVPDYTSKELHGLVAGSGGEHLRASLRRLHTLPAHLVQHQLTLPPRPQTSEASRISPISSRCTSHCQQPPPRPPRATPSRTPYCRRSQSVRHRHDAGASAPLSLLPRAALRQRGCCAKPPGLRKCRHGPAQRQSGPQAPGAIGWLQTFPAPQRLGTGGGAIRDQPLLDAGGSGARCCRPRHPVCHRFTTPAEFCTSKLPPLAKENRKPLQELNTRNPFHWRTPPPAARLAYLQQPTPVEPLVLSNRAKTKPQNPTLPPTLQHIVPTTCVIRRDSLPSSSKHSGTS